MIVRIQELFQRREVAEDISILVGRRNKSKETSQTLTKSWSSKAKTNEKDDDAFSPTIV